MVPRATSCARTPPPPALQSMGAPERGNSTVGGRTPTLMNTGLLLVAHPSCDSDSLCQPALGLTGLPDVSVTVPEIVPSAAAESDWEMTPARPMPPWSHASTGAVAVCARPLTRKTLFVGSGVEVGSRGAPISGGAGDGGACWSTTTSSESGALSAHS